MDPNPAFARHAAAACPGQGELALAVAAEFSEVDAGAAEAQLDLLALEVVPARRHAPADQLAALAAAMRAFAVVEPHVGSADLRVDEVLRTCEGHPLALAVIAAEAGVRAGLDVGLIGDGERHLVAHRQLAEPLALDLGSASRAPALRPVDEPRLTWRCAHQVGFALLGLLIARGTRGGDLPLALRAAELRLELPLADRVRRCQEDGLARLRARLN